MATEPNRAHSDAGSARRPRERVFILVIALALAVGIPFLVEFGLWLDSLRFPINGARDGQHYTWGHPVVSNESGFREREFEKKRPDAWRVLVLGDSITYGTGLPVEERFTNLVEERLRKWFPGKNIEVLNLGMPGINAERAAYLLKRSIDPLEPDLVVVGFCINDPQSGSTRSSPERDRLLWLFEAFHSLRYVGMRRLATFLDSRIHRLLTRFGVLPDNGEIIQRAYDTDSREWATFVASLQYIRAIGDERGLLQPIFAVLAGGAVLAAPVVGDPLDEGRELKIRLYQQAEAAARGASFVTVSYLEEIERELSPEEMVLHERDSHPSALLNRLYARKLAPLVAQALSARGLTR